MRWAITPPKVNQSRWNLEHFRYIVGGWPWQIMGAIRAAATAGEPGEFCFFVAWFHRYSVGRISRNLNTTSRSASRWKHAYKIYLPDKLLVNWQERNTSISLTAINIQIDTVTNIDTNTRNAVTRGRTDHSQFFSCNLKLWPMTLTSETLDWVKLNIMPNISYLWYQHTDIGDQRFTWTTKRSVHVNKYIKRVQHCSTLTNTDVEWRVKWRELNWTDCVRSVNAALVIDDGRLRPLVISLHSFLLITSTSPPFETTRRNSSYRSSVCLAMIGIRFTGVPTRTHARFKSSRDWPF